MGVLANTFSTEPILKITKNSKKKKRISEHSGHVWAKPKRDQRRFSGLLFTKIDR